MAYYLSNRNAKLHKISRQRNNQKKMNTISKQKKINTIVSFFTGIKTQKQIHVSTNCTTLTWHIKNYVQARSKLNARYIHPASSLINYSQTGMYMFIKQKKQQTTFLSSMVKLLISSHESQTKTMFSCEKEVHLKSFKINISIYLGSAA